MCQRSSNQHARCEDGRAYCAITSGAGEAIEHLMVVWGGSIAVSGLHGVSWTDVTIGGYDHQIGGMV